MFLTDPMLTCMTLYASFVYGLLFLTLEVFPIVFREQRGWEPVVSTLPFLALFVGVSCAMAVNLANQPLYARAVAKNQAPRGAGSSPATHDYWWLPVHHWTLLVRLDILAKHSLGIARHRCRYVSAPVFLLDMPLSKIWLTKFVAFIGAGFNIVFQQCMNFIIDTYGPYAASAMAANTFLRSLLACGLPLAARPMFLSMGVGPASSLLGGISCLALPVPMLFIKYGPKAKADVEIHVNCASKAIVASVRYKRVLPSPLSSSFS